jgi:prepilin-type N-terminal cleavage/methylation domain-containing protein
MWRLLRQRLEPAGDRGESLIELLVAVVILGTAVVAVVGGLGTGLMMSTLQRKQAEAAEHLSIYAALIETAPYDECPGVSYPTYNPGPGSGYTADPPAVLFRSGSSFVSSCPAGGDTGIQQVTLSVRSTDGRVNETRKIIIRKPCRPTETLCS